MEKTLEPSYLSFLAELKQSIIKSRVQAARLANKEMLLLYLTTGYHLSEKIKAEKWGTKIIKQIAADLQVELPGLRGFSERNLQNMRQFADEYSGLFGPVATGQTGNATGQSSTGQLASEITQSPTAQFQKPAGEPANARMEASTTEKGLAGEQLSSFFAISFTHHILLLNKCKKPEERFFYMQLAATQMLSVETLAHHIQAKTFKTQGKMPSNFAVALPAGMKATALDMFRDEYLFDFMQLDNIEDERVFEAAIVANIKKFILSLGRGFAFMGNQYRLELEEKEYATDLLFYNRILQCLVAFELKRGRFKPEYAGKLNFYLNLLDDKVKLPHENPSIGIILCKEKNNTEVEYSFRNINKAMGVATYKLSSDVPKEMKGILPDAETLKKLLNNKK